MLLIDEYHKRFIPHFHANDEFVLKAPSLQNLIILGPSCSGKSKIADKILSELYGSGVFKLKEHEYTINNYGSNVVRMKIMQSHYHLVFVPNNSALDKYVIQEVLVDFCRKKDMCYYKSSLGFKCVLIRKADELSEQAQYTLRRMMEDHAETCRFILLARNICNFVAPVRSRLTPIRLRSLYPSEMETTLIELCGESVPVSNVREIVSTVGRDLQRAVWMLESKRFGLQYHCYWKLHVDDILAMVFDKKATPLKYLRSLGLYREKVGALFVSNIRSDTITTYCVSKVVDFAEGNPVLTAELLGVIADYDHRMKNATRYMLHLEAMFHSLAHKSFQNNSIESKQCLT